MQVKPLGYHDFSQMSTPRLIKSPYRTHKQHWSKNAWQTLQNALYWVHRREGKQHHPRPLKPLSNRLPCVRSNDWWMRLSLQAKISRWLTLKSCHVPMSPMFICTAIWSPELVKLGSNFSMVVDNLTPQSLASMLFFLSMVFLAKVYSKRTISGSSSITTTAWFLSSQVCESPDSFPQFPQQKFSTD